MPAKVLERPVDNRRKANSARLIQKVSEVDPLECVRCGATLRIIVLIDRTEVIERILRHLDVWNPQPETCSCSPAGPDPPWPRGETIPLTYHPALTDAIEFPILRRAASGTDRGKERESAVINSRANGRRGARIPGDVHAAVQPRVGDVHRAEAPG